MQDLDGPWNLSESRLRMPRAKPRSLMVSAGYRVTQLLKLLLGRTRVLKLYLDLTWLLRRLAFEISGEVYGERFPSGSLALSTDVLERWIPRGGTVVDIGCGMGRWSRFAARFADRVVGVDLRPEQIAAAARLSSAIPTARIEYVTGDGAVMLGERRFDVALLIQVLEHLDDGDALLKTLTRAVSILIIEVPDFDAEPLNYVRQRLGRRFESDADHVQEYNREILDAQLRRCGWFPTEWQHKGGSVLAVAMPAVGSR